jgi:hypothetical protein
MTTLLEDLRVELRQMCQAVGLSGKAAGVVPLVLLGIALNVAALSVIGVVRPAHSSACNRPPLRSAARTELKVARAVLASTLKTIGDGRRRWCSAEQRFPNQQFGTVDLHMRAASLSLSHCFTNPLEDCRAS